MKLFLCAFEEPFCGCYVHATAWDDTLKRYNQHRCVVLASTLVTVDCIGYGETKLIQIKVLEAWVLRISFLVLTPESLQRLGKNLGVQRVTTSKQIPWSVLQKIGRPR